MRNPIIKFSQSISLIGVSTLLMGLSTLPVRENPKVLDSIISELVGARLAEEPIKILDVGCSDGKFQVNTKEFLSRRGINAELWGVDNLDSFDIERYWKLLFKDRPEYIFLFSSVQQLSPKFDMFFDYVFINSPYLANVNEVIEASIKLVKDDGYVIVRFHYGDELSKKTPEILEFKGYKVTVQTMYLPEGDNLLSRKAFLITRGEFNPIKKVQFEKVFGVRLAEVSA